jgi:hypothetical protein
MAQKARPTSRATAEAGKQADLSTYEEQIRKTGFVLENEVARQLKNAGWTVISNRYYVDDSEEKVREIDLVAYRSSKVKNVRIYTSLIISCKKDQDSAWALLARDLDPKDPNSDWWPLHSWTNDKAIEYELSQPGAAKKYHDDINAAGVEDALRLPPVEVFAFQLMNRKTGTPQNDKSIFESLTSLMKAQSYELNALPLRRKGPEKCVYQFNLITVADTDLVRLHMKGDKIAAERIPSEHYIVRYIVSKKEMFSRIRFIQADHFGKCLDDYARLHSANCQWFLGQRANFYSEAVKDGQRVEVFVKTFRAGAAWYVAARIRQHLGQTVDLGDLSVEWRTDRNEVAVTEWFSDEMLAFLNSNEDCKRRVAGELMDTYSYTGPFFFDTPEIPF